MRTPGLGRPVDITLGEDRAVEIANPAKNLLNGTPVFLNLLDDEENTVVDAVEVDAYRLPDLLQQRIRPPPGLNQ
jgi:hypothetical protein